MPDSGITFVGLDFTGSPNDFDVRAAKLIIGLENTRRAADLDENGDPVLPPLPDTGAGLKASYLGLLTDKNCTGAHASYIEQASVADPDVKALWKDATDAQRAAAITALGG